MGDLGKFDEEGVLWFCGRKSHRVITPSGELYTIPCEAVFNVHPKVFRTALVGVGKANSRKPVLCVELEKEAQDAHRDEIRAQLLELGSRHPHTRAIATFLFHKGFPVDVRHNAKIGREKLARWASAKPGGGT